MLLLAFDTAGPDVTVALHDGTAVVATARGEGRMAHGELLSPCIRQVMNDHGAQMSDLTDIAVGVGPGPYTGLRVGVVTALTLEQALNLTTHGVCSLDPLAAGREGEFIAAIDARRKEVYWARYVDGKRVDGPHVDKPAAVAARGLACIGPATLLYPEVFSPDDTELSAASLAEAVVAHAVQELTLEPLYLRRPDAQIPGALKRA